MKCIYTILAIILVSVSFNISAQVGFYESDVLLIAHRGGVVDSITPENSKEAIIKAAELGYWMVEIDIQVTKDGVLITNHDRNLKKCYGIDRDIADMKWEEISELKSETGALVQNFEDVLTLCRELGLNVMIDNKIKGYDYNLCTRIVNLLDKYELREQALMIGTSATTEFFTGKIRLSCTRQQLENNMLRKDYSPNNYYYFGNPTKEDAEWAREHGIMIVGVINEWAIPKVNEDSIVKETVKNLVDQKVRYIQLDSMYASYLHNQKIIID